MDAIRIVLIDYDGTIAATRLAIVECLTQALAAAGVPDPSLDAIEAVIASGVPIQAAFASFAPRDSVENCVRIYRERYPETDLRMTTIFDGARETIETLAAFGVPLVILSNKGSVAVKAALERFDLAKNIRAVIAGEPGQPSKPDPKVFDERVAPLFPGCRKASFLMVGDTASDLAFARAVKIRSCWASYGYGDPDDCRALAPDYRIGTISALASIARLGWIADL